MTLALGFFNGSESQTIWLEMPKLSIGRDEGCDLRFQDASVGAWHCLILRRGDEWLIEELQSGAATRVNGEPLEPGASQPLAAGDVLELGRIRLELSDPASAAVEEPSVSYADSTVGLMQQVELLRAYNPNAEVVNLDAEHNRCFLEDARTNPARQTHVLAGPVNISEQEPVANADVEPDESGPLALEIARIIRRYRQQHPKLSRDAVQKALTTVYRTVAPAVAMTA